MKVLGYEQDFDKVGPEGAELGLGKNRGFPLKNGNSYMQRSAETVTCKERACQQFCR